MESPEVRGKDWEGRFSAGDFPYFVRPFFEESKGSLISWGKRDEGEICEKKNSTKRI